MKISKKIQILRKRDNYSQEQLAEICGVSRQAVSKWERDTLPELDQLIKLSTIFQVSLDTLIKEDLIIDAKLENHTCHTKKEEFMQGIFEGLLIKESIEDENILDILNIHKVELWKTDDKLKYWTALYFTSNDIALPEKLSKVLISELEKGGPWYTDFKKNNTQYIVFKNKILHYQIGNIKEKENVEEECKKLGISNIDI